MVIPIKKEVPLHSLLGDFNLNLITIASAVHLLHYKRKKEQVLYVSIIFLCPTNTMALFSYYRDSKPKIATVA